MRRRIAITLPLTAVLVLAMTAVAFAENGEGLAGETDDKMVTIWGLALVGGFTLFVILASALQAALDRRKQAKKAAATLHRAGW